jgi:hypothetical protein
MFDRGMRTSDGEQKSRLHARPSFDVVAVESCCGCPPVTSPALSHQAAQERRFER